MGYVTWRGYRYTPKVFFKMSVHSKTNFLNKTQNVILWFQIRLPGITNQINGNINKNLI